MLESSSVSRNSTTVRLPASVRLARVALQTAFGISPNLGSSFAERLFTTPRRHRRPQRERAILATGRPFTIDVLLRSPRWAGHHTRLAAWRWGLGPTVLLVHGWEGRGSQLGALVEPLVAAGLSVVTFDAHAHGDSPGSRLYLTDHADAISDVVEAIGPVHAIIAHSFGAAAVLLAHARGGVDAARNVMIAPNVLIDDAVTRFARAVALDGADRERFEDHLTTASGVGMDSLTIGRLVAGRDAELLVIHDRADREVPFVHGERLAATWPGAQLRETTNLGHRRILRDPAVIAEIVEFASHGVPPAASDLVREVDRLLQP
ncbi:MAG: alpha/beta fold hydrolase [Deltaproteobacteria bacterium]|nr:alpha/beta fold hydrolase [Deltaproteobacteria bacterium]MDQ3295611.1 lysophospholipase [Myxococcota bacterium]